MLNVLLVALSGLISHAMHLSRVAFVSLVVLYVGLSCVVVCHIVLYVSLYCVAALSCVGLLLHYFSFVAFC